MRDCKGRINQGVYNCWGVYDHTLCYHCIHNAGDTEFEKTGNMFKSRKDAIDVLYKYLKGEELPEGVKCQMPKLDDITAFSVVWFLQEIMHCLPDSIEQCDGCKELFDANSEGHSLDDQYKLNGKTLPKKYWGHWCDGCVPNVDFKLK